MTQAQAALATKHGKLAQIAPAFAEILDWQLLLAEIDTDEFGSFDGTKPRLLSPRETVLAKAKAGAEKLGLRFGLASEGTIGAHPQYPFSTSDAELIGFVDLELGTELVVSHVSPKIFAARFELSKRQQLPDFVSLFDLPNHALIVRAHLSQEEIIHKGITSASKVRQILEELASNPGFEKAVIESDFRAMHSPSRQRNIEACARLAAGRISTLCPACNYLGWGVKGYEFGLVCSICGFENGHLARAEILGCISCSHEVTDGLKPNAARPEQCLSCNP